MNVNQDVPSRLRRSCLAVPGSSQRFLASAAKAKADEIIFDLEDSVPPSEKSAARSFVIEAMKGHSYQSPTKAVRINKINSAWGLDDLITLVKNAGPHIDCVVLPKVENTTDVTIVDVSLRSLEESTGLRKRIGLEVLIETAQALESIHEITESCDRLEALIFGPLDMSVALGLPSVPRSGALPGYEGLDAWHYVRMCISVAAHARNLQAIDGPHLLVKDVGGFRADAMQARALGYAGKWAIYPGQLPTLNEIFST